MKNYIIIALGLALAITGWAQTPTQFQTDILRFGRASSSTAKQLIWDTGDGALNKMLSLDATTKEFTLNSKLNVTGAVAASGAISAGGAISTTSGNISTASGAISATGNISTSGGNISASGSVSGASASFTGSSVHQSGITLGSGTNTSRQITVDRASADTYIKWNESTGKWTFSNDGTVEKNLGSGSGGDAGITVLLNGSWEDGANVDWTSSGGTYSTATYANAPADDNIYFTFTATTSGQYVESVLHAIPTPVTGGCLAKLDYNTTDSSNWKIQIYDSTSALLAEGTLTAKTWQAGYVPFPCPSSGTTVKMRVVSLGAGSIQGDHAYLGKENRTFQVSAASYYGGLKYAGTPLCDWQVASGTGAGTVFGADTDCSTPSTSGSVTAPGTKIPGFTMTTKKGRYVIMYKGSFSDNTNDGVEAIISLTDGTNFYTTNGMYANATALIVPVMVFEFTETSPGTKTFNLWCASENTTTQSCRSYAGSTKTDLNIDVYFYPTDSETALRPEAQDWFIDVNIGGSNPNLGTAAISSYAAINDTGLDMVLRTGSAAAEIPCTGTTASVGLTCNTPAVAEEIGVAFTNPTPGFYEACMDFTHQPSLGSGASVEATFQLVETPINSNSTITQEGGTRVESRANAAATNTYAFPHRICGTFYFASSAKRAIRLMFEQTVGATISTNTLLADRGASNGQRDIHVVVRPLLSPFNRPYIIGNRKFQRKNLSANTSSAGVISDLTINNLTVGKNYELITCLDFQGTTQKTVQILNGATQIGGLEMSAGSSELNTCAVVTFTAVSSTVTHNFSTASSQIQGGGATSYTIIKEMFDYESTTQY